MFEWVLNKSLQMFYIRNNDKIGHMTQIKLSKNRHLGRLKRKTNTGGETPHHAVAFTVETKREDYKS